MEPEEKEIEDVLELPMEFTLIRRLVVASDSPDKEGEENGFPKKSRLYVLHILLENGAIVRIWKDCKPGFQEIINIHTGGNPKLRGG